MSFVSTPDPSAPRTRERLLTVAMELFGRQGFRMTTIAQIEAAAGLSAGAGGLYRHFPSKDALLAAGLRQQIASGQQLIAFIEDPRLLTTLPLEESLLQVARAGLVRLQQERDLNRLLLRDLAAFPDLLEEVRQQELARVFGVLVQWLRAQHPPEGLDVDALASVLMGAVSHYWVLADIFGASPHGIEAERYLRTLAQIAAAGMGQHRSG